MKGSSGAPVCVRVCVCARCMCEAWKKTMTSYHRRLVGSPPFEKKNWHNFLQLHWSGKLLPREEGRESRQGKVIPPIFSFSPSEWMMSCHWQRPCSCGLRLFSPIQHKQEYVCWRICNGSWIQISPFLPSQPTKLLRRSSLRTFWWRLLIDPSNKKQLCKSYRNPRPALAIAHAYKEHEHKANCEEGREKRQKGRGRQLNNCKCHYHLRTPLLMLTKTTSWLMEETSIRRHHSSRFTSKK